MLLKIYTENLRLVNYDLLVKSKLVDNEKIFLILIKKIISTLCFNCIKHFPIKIFFMSNFDHVKLDTTVLNVHFDLKFIGFSFVS